MGLCAQDALAERIHVPDQILLQVLRASSYDHLTAALALGPNVKIEKLRTQNKINLNGFNHYSAAGAPHKGWTTTNKREIHNFARHYYFSRAPIVEEKKKNQDAPATIKTP